MTAGLEDVPTARTYLFPPFVDNDFMGGVRRGPLKGGVRRSLRRIARDAKAVLREPVEYYRTAVDNADAAATIHIGRKRLYVNRTFLEMFGYESEEEALAEEALTLLHPDDLERVEEYVRARERGEPTASRCECRVIRKDGGVVCVEASTKRIVSQEGPASLVYLRDVTEQKRAEEALRESEEKFRILFENSAYPVFLLDGLIFIDCNETALRLTGCPRKELLVGRSPWELSPERQPDGRLSIDKAKEMIDLTLKQGVNHFEWVRCSLSGREVWSEVSLPVMSIRGRQIIYTEWRDITDRKQTEASLRESEERYRIAVENSNDGVAIVQGDKHVYVNQRFVDVFGYERGEVLGKDPSLTVHPDDLEMVMKYNRKRQEGRSAPGRYDFRGIRKDGARIFVEASAAPITHGQKPASLVFIRDMTERKALEAQLLHAQKMEAIGTLAAGVAHDFNNILMALMGYANLLQLKMDPNDPARTYADKIISCTGNAAGLTQSLLAFGRKQVIELKPHSVGAMVRNVETLLRRLLPADVRLTFDLIRDTTVMADASQIAQVLVNLAANARDAMPEGGELGIEIGEVKIDQRFIADQGYVKPGLYALISVSDTGTGMDKKALERIFEPFYTTKEVGKGTGLGLSIAYGIVKQHQGYIVAASEPGRGTAFRIYLPKIREKIAKEEKPAGRAAGGTETILIADDNPDIRKIASEILGAAGYRVIEAVDGRDAVERFTAGRDEIDLLLLDVVMPGKKGNEAYEEMRRLRQNIKVLFMTGYSGEMLSDRGMREKALVAKPLTPDALLRRVRDILDSSA